MQIEHLALWVQDLEAMKDFYLNYFDVVSGRNIRMTPNALLPILSILEKVEPDWS